MRELRHAESGVNDVTVLMSEEPPFPLCRFGVFAEGRLNIVMKQVAALMQSHKFLAAEGSKLVCASFSG